ncbi:retrotransposon protein, putative, ty1-copia subclass [Tanacetum coccineum]
MNRWQRMTRVYGQIKKRDLMVTAGMRWLIKDNYSGRWEASEKAALIEEGIQNLILCLGDRVLKQKVPKETISSIRNLDRMETLFVWRNGILDHEDVSGALFEFQGELKNRTKAQRKSGDGFILRGKSNHLSKAHSSRSSQFKSRGGTGKLKCFICHSDGHLKRFCPMKKSSGFIKKGNRNQDSTDTSMTRVTAYFRESPGGTGKVKIQLHDGSSFILKDVRWVGIKDDQRLSVRLNDGIKEKELCSILYKKQSDDFCEGLRSSDLGIVGDELQGREAYWRRRAEGPSQPHSGISRMRRALSSSDLLPVLHTSSTQAHNLFSSLLNATISCPRQGGPRFEVPAQGKDVEYWLCLSVTPKVEIVGILGANLNIGKEFPIRIRKVFYPLIPLNRDEGGCEAAFILGIKIYRDRSKRLIRLGQNSYMDKILKRYKMDNSKRGHIPMQERLDLNKTQGASTPEEVKRMQNVPYASNPGEPHWTAVKNILKICFRFERKRGGLEELQAKYYRMSATEDEYIAASEAAMEAVWIKKFISEHGIVPTINEQIKMFYDNSAALLIANEPGVQKGAKHYHRRYHYVHECIELGEINLLKVHTDDNLADPFTKALPKGKLTQHARSIGLCLASSFM